MPDDVDCEKTLLKLNDLKVTDEVEDNTKWKTTLQAL